MLCLYYCLCGFGVGDWIDCGVLVEDVWVVVLIYCVD